MIDIDEHELEKRVLDKSEMTKGQRELAKIDKLTQLDMFDDPKRVPGEFGWDPLKLYDVFGKQAPAMVEMRMENDPDYRLKWVEFNRQEMAKAEIKNGRLAMLAIVSFAMQEALWKTPVVDQTPLFFTPIFKILFGAGQDGF